MDAAAQRLPEAFAVSACFGEPKVPEPEKSLMVIVDESPGAVPATPENAGLLVFSLLPLAGVLSVTAGGAESTIHDACAGVGSVRPDGLIARTSNACRPSTSAP